MTTDTITKFTNYRIYKPKKTLDGSASQIELKLTIDEEKYKRKCEVFWTIAKQKSELDKDENAQFEWDREKTIVMKLGIADLGELLTVLRGKKTTAGTDKGLFHKNKLGNTVMLFRYYAPENACPMYTLKISSQKDKELTSMQHTFTLGEAEVLEILLTKAVEQTYGW